MLIKVEKTQLYWGSEVDENWSCDQLQRETSQWVGVRVDMISKTTNSDVIMVYC